MKRRPLDEVIALARRDFGADASRRADWERIDHSLFTRIEAERAAERARLAKPRGRRWAYVGSIAMAVAASFGILLGKSHEPPSAPPALVHADLLAGRLAETRGEGSVLLNGIAVAPGASVRLGDSLETRGAEATIIREGAASIVVEQNSRLQVRQVSGTLILALERGAVQARVTPIAAGEAFAVDVADTRIAVHGTVLRVTRAGDHAAVDLAEGVVSVGPAPRVGPLLGSLVTAPAHVEFSVADALKTLSVTHDPTRVRPIPLSSSASALTAPRPDEPEKFRARSEPSAPRSAPSLGSPMPPSHVDARSASSTPQPAGNAEVGGSDSVEAAVIACMRERPRAENVTVVVNTTLYLDVGDDGAVRTARFDPPVMPDVNGCAASAIYKMHFPRSGALAIPIEFKN
ncbi:MAG TPA: FecR domain-containing protein [Polyangiaceae bacterium]|nr:FecR domain-containing protein [Polyangiaceae bacterium]